MRHLPGPASIYVPKFRAHRAHPKRKSQRQTTLGEVAEESPERRASAEPEDAQAKRASAPVFRTPDKDDKVKSPEESVALLTEEKPSTSVTVEDEHHPPERSLSQKGRGKFERQQESIM